MYLFGSFGNAFVALNAILNKELKCHWSGFGIKKLHIFF